MAIQFKAAVVQAAPVFMDLAGCIDKAIALIKRAAEQGARIIAFPECWFPGYPWWLWLSATAHNVKYFQRYHENSLVVGDDHFRQLAQAAKDQHIFVSVGASEREYGSLYIAQFLFNDRGELIQGRRKLKATHVERTVFGESDGSHLQVCATDIGRIGQLSCWEHIQPLVKYALYSMHEQVHIAAWPAFSLYPDAYALGAKANAAATQTYAMEGQCYVLSPCGMVSDDMYQTMVDTEAQAALFAVGGGYAQIYGPDGRPLCEPLAATEEGLLYADIDLGAIAIAKSFADPVGHYARPDVAKLLLNRRPQSTVQDMMPESPKEVTVSLDDSDLCRDQSS